MYFNHTFITLLHFLKLNFHWMIKSIRDILLNISFCERRKKPVRFGTTWVRVNDDRAFIFWVNYPFFFSSSSCPGSVCDRSLFFFAGIYVLFVPKCLNVFLTLLSNVYLGLRTLRKNDKSELLEVFRLKYAHHSVLWSVRRTRFCLLTLTMFLCSSNRPASVKQWLFERSHTRPAAYCLWNTCINNAWWLPFFYWA